MLKNAIIFAILFIAEIASAAYSPGTYLTDSTGNYIDPRARTWSLLNTTDSVNVGNFPTSFNIGNFPATQPVSGSVSVSGSVPVTGTFWQTTQPVSGSLGRSWSLSSGSDSVNVGNFPSSFSVSNFPSSFSVSNFPSSQAVTGPLTDTQLRANPVPVTGSLSVANPTDYSSTGTIAANGTAVTVTGLNGSSDATFSLSGTWAGSLNAQGSIDGTVWDNLTMFQSAAGTSLWSSSPITANGNVRVAGIAGYKQVRVVSTAWTSGTASITLNVTTGANILNVKQSNPANLKVTANLADGSGNAISSTSGALNIAGTVGISGTVPVSGTFYQATQPVSVGSLPLPSGAATSANQSTEISSLSTIATNTTGAATAANQSSQITQETAINSYLFNINSKIPAQGQTTMSASQPVTLASDQTSIPVVASDLYVTGASAQTAVVNNILPATSGTAATDLNMYRSGFVQVVSTGTAGAFIFEGSNDNVNFQTITVYNQLIPATAIVAAITPTVSQLGYTFPVQFRYIRLRISTAVTGGSIQAFSRFSQGAWSPPSQNAAISAGTLTTVGTVSTVTTVAAVTAANLTQTAATDIASAAITATATSSSIALTGIQQMSFVVPVTVVSGTSPTLDLVIQESYDNANWIDVYHFERITATGAFISPRMRIHGLYIRYVRTITGTTPSFTMSLNRIYGSGPAPLYRRIFDRAIAPNTLNSTTATLIGDGCDEVQLVQSSGAGATTNPVFTLEGSETAGASDWYAINTSGTPITLTGTPSTTSASYVGAIPKFIRARVSTAGIAATINYIALKCRGGS